MSMSRFWTWLSYPVVDFIYLILYTVCFFAHKFSKILRQQISWKILLLSPATGGVALSMDCATFTSLSLFSDQEAHRSFEDDEISFLMGPPWEKSQAREGIFWCSVLLKVSLENTSKCCKLRKSQLVILQMDQPIQSCCSPTGRVDVKTAAFTAAIDKGCSNFFR